MGAELALAFFQRFVSMHNATPVSVSGARTFEILWPLNAVFRPYMTRIRTLAYEARFEPEADKAIERFADNPKSDARAAVSPGAWRVLLERHQQLLMLAKMYEMRGENFTVLPSGLPRSAELPGIMLLWLHQMRLPFPLVDRSELALPEGPPPGSMTLH